MKNKFTLSVIGAALFASAMVNLPRMACAQVSNATPTWSSSFPNKPDFLLFANPDASIVLGTNQTDASVIDGKTGTVLWNTEFNEMLGSKKCGLQYAMDEAGVLFLFNKKGNKDMLHVLDLHSGKELWKTDRFKDLRLSSVLYMAEIKSFVVVTDEALHLLDARTGEQKWQTDKFRGAVAHTYFDAAKNELIVLNYKTSWGALLSGYKNQIMSINVANGNVNWDESYFGVMNINPLTNRPVFDMTVKDNHIYLTINGLQVLDRNSGRELWKAEYDLFDQKIPIGAPGYIYYYKGVAYPLISDDAVYLVHNKLAGGKVTIQKLNKETGNLLWEHKVDGRNNPVPTLALANGKLLAQLGGRVNIVGPTKIGDSYITTSKYKWVGNYGLLALDAATGAVAWEQKKLDDRMTNPEIVGDKVYFADAKKLYSVNIATGSVEGTVPVKTMKCGDPFEVLKSGNRIVCAGAKGLSGLDGLSVAYTVPLKDVQDYSESVGGKYILKGEKAMNVVDLQSGKSLAMYKYEKGGKYSIGNNGNTLTVISPKKVQRYDFN